MGPDRRPAPTQRLLAALSGWVSDPVDRVLVALFAVVKVLEITTSAPSTYPDTPTYRVAGSFLDFSLTSLGGRSVRPWGVTAWLALWPSEESIVLAQTALSIVAWVALALALASTIRHRTVRTFLVAVLFVLGATAQVASWQLAILSESVCMSTGLLALALLIRLVQRASWGRAVAFLLAALWFAMTRPNTFPVLLGWAVVLLVGAWKPQRMRGRVSAVVGGALVVVSLYSYVYNVRADPAWRASPVFGVSRTLVAYAYPVSGNGPVAGDVLRDLRRSGAPRCMIPDYPEQVSAAGTTAWVRARAASCPEMESWADAHWSSWWSSWLLRHPLDTLTIIRTELPSSLSPPIWTGVAAAVPTSVSSVFFGTADLPQSAVPTSTFTTQPLIGWLAVAAGLFWVERRRRKSPEPTQRPPAPPESRVLPILVATGVGALVSAVSSGLIIQTTSFEVGRESAGVTVVLTASCVALVVMLVDRLLDVSRLRSTERADLPR